MKFHKKKKLFAIVEQVLHNPDQPNDAPKKKLSKKSQRIVDAINKGKSLFGFGKKPKTKNYPYGQETGVVASGNTGGKMAGGGGQHRAPHVNNYPEQGPLVSHPLPGREVWERPSREISERVERARASLQPETDQPSEGLSTELENNEKEKVAEEERVGNLVPGVQ